MDVLDEKGRLFGRVNVVDLLVVLFVLAVAVASIALVMGNSNQENPEPSTPERLRYAMFSFDTQFESDAADLDVGDSLSSNGGDVLEVVDLHRSFGANGSAHLTVRGAYRGNLTDDNGRVYGGDIVDLTTDRYRVNATVLAANVSEETIPTRTVPVVLAIHTSSPVEQYLQPDQEVQLGDQTVATVRALSEPNGSGEARLLVGVELRAWDRGGTAVFGGRALRVGTPVTLVTDDVVLRGRVHELNTAEPSTD